jgi:hypothetical protein
MIIKKVIDCFDWIVFGVLNWSYPFIFIGGGVDLFLGEIQ